MTLPKYAVPAPHIRKLIEEFAAPPAPAPVSITPAEATLIGEIENALMALMPCSLAMGRRWYAPTAKLLALGHARAGLTGTELSTCRSLIHEAKAAIHEANNARRA